MSKTVPVGIGLVSFVVTSWAATAGPGNATLVSYSAAGRPQSAVTSGELPVMFSSTSQVTLLSENGLAVVAGLGPMADATAGVTPLIAPPKPTTDSLPIPLAPPPPPPPPPAPPEYSQTGVVSWYASPAGTCASPGLAFGTVVTVTNTYTGASAQCVVNDRGPYVGGRILDLSPATFANLAPLGQGLMSAVLHWQ